VLLVSYEQLAMNALPLLSAPACQRSDEPNSERASQLYVPPLCTRASISIHDADH